MKLLLGKRPQFDVFAVEASEKPIVGIPPEIAHEYWIEVFGLPGFEKHTGRYLLSQTNAAEAVGKTNTSIIDFLNSNTLKALLGKRPELSSFAVENSEKPIVGIPPEIAHEYWIEVFGLPGFEKHTGRYLLSQTNAAEAVGKDAVSIFDFLNSNTLKVLLGKRPEFLPFTVENSQKPIIGIPPEIAHEYWMEQVAKGNTKARSHLWHCLISKLVRTKSP